MSTYLRLFVSSVDPADVDEVRRLFVDDVQPAFRAFEGCLGVGLAVSVEKNAGGLVGDAVVSRWASLEEMESTVTSREVQEAIVRVRQILCQEPIARVFEIIE